MKEQILMILCKKYGYLFHLDEYLVNIYIWVILVTNIKINFFFFFLFLNYNVILVFIPILNSDFVRFSYLRNTWTQSFSSNGVNYFLVYQTVNHIGVDRKGTCGLHLT